jgi:ubiquinone/menaquinone biosynthesis C-methylase UbiE
VPLDPLAEQGFNAALAYEHGRPGYAPEAVDTLVSELGLDRSSRVLDLAAGTGKLSRMLAPLVGSVVAVEPSASMREVLARQLPDAEVLAGEAERLPVPDHSLDAVVVGEAFHWFDGETALREMARVLRPHGGLALLWNVELAADPPWPAELVEELERHRKANVSAARWYRSGAWRHAFDSGPFEALSSAQAEHVQHLDREAIVAQIASWSYIAALPEASRDSALALVRELAPSTCAISFRTDVYWTRSR